MGTDAGTPIDNFATVNYKVGGIDQTAVDSPTTQFLVDQVVDLTVAEADGADTDVSPAETGAVARFTVTNTGNETQDFNLSIADLIGGSVFGNPDTIDADALTIVIDANGNDVYDAGTDTVATFIDELSADDTNPDPLLDNVVSVFILGDIPAGAADGAAINIELTATAHKAGGAGLGVIEAETGVNDDPSTVQIVFSNNTGSDQDSYLVGSAALAATKASEVVSDPLGQVAPAALAIPGALVEYEVTITNTGGSPATEVQVTDDIQGELTFATGTYNGAAADVEIVVGASPAVYCVAEIGGVDTNADGCFRDAAGDSLTVSIPVSAGFPTGLTVGTTAPDDEVVVRFQVSID
ncbi:MAG: hypothetical protein ACN4GT_05315 [Gammaproteobacteria bacterium]